MQHNWQHALISSLYNSPLQQYLPEISMLMRDWTSTQNHKEAIKWQKQLRQLPNLPDCTLQVTNQVSVLSSQALDANQLAKTSSVLKNFMPWRKGPFSLFDINIDTEWRSDWKWDRVMPHIKSLQGARVLDVGCGSGYHLFRMHEQGASHVLGIDPTALFFYQFQCFKQYLPDLNIHYLPVGIESMPSTNAFDAVFSMGVLYHRPDPIKFLKELKQQLQPKGELILETLIVDGDENTAFMPPQRYAQMRNVWFLPSIKSLTLWLKRVGFKNVDCVDIDTTSVNEQRATEWMQNHSLIDFLDPNDTSKTVEGHPAPKRAVFIAH